MPIPMSLLRAGGRLAAHGARAVIGHRGRRRHHKKSLSPKMIGELMLLGQIFGRRSPAMTMAAMKVMGRI